MIYKNNVKETKFFASLILPKELHDRLMILVDIMEEVRKGDETACVKYRAYSQKMFEKMFKSYDTFPTDIKHKMFGLQSFAQSTIDQFIVLLAKGSALINQRDKNFKEYENPVKKDIKISPLLEQVISIYLSPDSVKENAVTEQMSKLLESALEVLSNEQEITM